MRKVSVVKNNVFGFKAFTPNILAIIHVTVPCGLSCPGVNTVGDQKRTKYYLKYVDIFVWPSLMLACSHSLRHTIHCRESLVDDAARS